MKSAKKIVKKREGEDTDILLTGVPNAGKTTLFNALTGLRRRTGNYHGVTVKTFVAQSVFSNVGYVYDLPGLYALSGGRAEEIEAKNALKSVRRAAVVQVIDARKIVTSLPLLCDLIAAGESPVVVFTMAEKLRRSGGKIDLAEFTKITGVPAYFVNALDKRSVRNFVDAILREERTLTGVSRKSAAVRATASEMEAAIKKTAYVSPKRNANDVEKSDRFLSSCWLLPAFFLAVACVFYLTFGKDSLGDTMKRGIERFFSFLSQCAETSIRNPFLKSTICGGLLGGVGGVISFLPQIALLYLFADFLEESGIASVLAYASDGLFSLVGLSGRAAFGVLLGYGCTAAGIASAGTLEGDSAKRRVTACLYFVPCSAKLPVYLTLLSSLLKNPFVGAVLLYVLGTGAGLAVAAFCGGKEEDFIMEIADFSFPSPIYLVKKLLFRLKGFIIKVSTAVAAFTTAAYALSSFNFSGACSAEDSILAYISRALVVLFYPMGVRDWRAAFAAAGGLLAKENVSGLLFALYPEGLFLSKNAAAAYLTFVALLPPCVAAIGSAAKEIGKKYALKYAFLQIVAAFFCAYAVYFALCCGVLFVISALIVVVLLVVVYVIRRRGVKRRFRKIYRHRIKKGE